MAFPLVFVFAGVKVSAALPKCRGRGPGWGQAQPGHCCLEGTVPSASSDVSLFPVTALHCGSSQPQQDTLPGCPSLHSPYPHPPAHQLLQSPCSHSLISSRPVSRGPGSRLSCTERNRTSSCEDFVQGSSFRCVSVTVIFL